MSWRNDDQYKSMEVKRMNKIVKTGLGVGVTSLLALGIAMPVFKDVDVKTLSVSGIQAATAFVADEDDIEKVTETSTDSTTEAASEATTEAITVATPDEASLDAKEKAVEAIIDRPQIETDVQEHKNYIEFSYDNTPGSLMPQFEGYSYDDDEALFEESKQFDINKYDEELQKIAQEYLAQGYYLSDLEYYAKVWSTGVGYIIDDEVNNTTTEVWFTNGFDVVDDDNGNNTFYITVLRMTPEEFAMYEKESELILNDSRIETDDEIKYESHDEYNNFTITYNKKTGIYMESNYFSEAAMNAEG